jgi:ATP-dependent Lon protease
MAPKPAIAMTGELTLTGRVLPIGGLKDKVLAAIRNGMERVLLPEDTLEDWNDLDKEIREVIAAEFVETADQAFAILFDGRIAKPAPARKTRSAGKGSPAAADRPMFAQKP